MQAAQSRIAQDGLSLVTVCCFQHPGRLHLEHVKVCSCEAPLRVLGLAWWALPLLTCGASEWRQSGVFLKAAVLV